MQEELQSWCLREKFFFSFNSVLQMSPGMTLYGGYLSTILSPRESSKMKCLAGCKGLEIGVSKWLIHNSDIQRKQNYPSQWNSFIDIYQDTSSQFQPWQQTELSFHLIGNQRQRQNSLLSKMSSSATFKRRIETFILILRTVLPFSVGSPVNISRF